MSEVFRNGKVRIKKFGGFDYIDAEISPSEISAEFGPLVTADQWKKIEHAAAKHILETPRPICGREFMFLRKVAGLSLRETAREFRVEHPTIMNWEQKLDGRVGFSEEIYARILFGRIILKNKKFDSDLAERMKSETRLSPVKLVA